MISRGTATVSEAAAKQTQSLSFASSVQYSRVMMEAVRGTLSNVIPCKENPRRPTTFSLTGETESSLPESKKTKVQSSRMSVPSACGVRASRLRRHWSEVHTCTYVTEHSGVQLAPPRAPEVAGVHDVCIR